MPGKAFRVGDQYLGRRAPERRPQRVHLSLGGAAAGRSVRLVAHEERVLTQLGGFDAQPLGRGGHQSPHHAGHVLPVQSRPVVGAVGHLGADELRDRDHASFGRRFGGLHDHRHGAHPHDHTVATLVERQRGVFYFSRVCGGARGQEAGHVPLGHLAMCDVVRADHDDPPTPPRADPVFGHRQRGRGRRAGAVDLYVGPPGLQQLGQLLVGVHDGAQQEVTRVAIVARLLRLLVYFADELRDARKGRRKNDAGLVSNLRR